MSILKTIFGSNSVAKVQKVTIFDFFEIDLLNIPDESFTIGEVTMNSANETVKKYRKSLNYKECGIFDDVEVIEVGESNRNVVFRAFQLKEINNNLLRSLIDELYLLYGLDASGMGKFTDKDMEYYLSPDFNCLFGRTWTEYPKYKYPLSINRFEEYISLTIFGLHLDDK
jgi:hypothetical protein